MRQISLHSEKIGRYPEPMEAGRRGFTPGPNCRKSGNLIRFHPRSRIERHADRIERENDDAALTQRQSRIRWHEGGWGQVRSPFFVVRYVRDKDGHAIARGPGKLLEGIPLPDAY